MPLILFLLFIVLPIAEIAVFIEAGRVIGVAATIALTLATAFAGSILMRMQGMAALQRFMLAAEKGEMPLLPVIDGMGILLAGVLLLTPGLLTDAIGLLLFVPAVRRAVARAAFQRLLTSGHVHFHYRGSASDWPRGGSAPRTGPGRGPLRQDGRPHRSKHVVDAEFEEVDPRESGKKPPRLEQGDEDERNSGDKSSPWREE